MPQPSRFAVGDMVIHTRRREWGHGVVDEAVDIAHEGQTAQRLIVRFTHHGRVALNTGVAPLVSKDAADTMREQPASSMSASADGPGGWLAALEGKQQKGGELQRLPDELNDPFRTLEQRIEATLSTHRFTTEPRSLLEWAVAQTGLDDPMSKYTRHELEQGFEWYCRDRDLHLRELVRQAKQSGRLDMIDQVRRRQKLPAAVSALDKARNSL